MRNSTFRLRERLKCAGGEPPPVSHQELVAIAFNVDIWCQMSSDKLMLLNFTLSNFDTVKLFVSAHVFALKMSNTKYATKQPFTRC